MTSKEDYSWMKAYAAKWISEQRAAEEAAKKPRLALVTPNERIENVKTPDDSPEKTIALPPLYEHGAFDDLYDATRMLDLGTDALRGIAAMMEPATQHGDEQLDNARRSDLSAVFRFFGEAMKSPATIAAESIERLQRAAQGEVV